MNKIIEFQKNNGLVADGILGKLSFAKMKELWDLTDEQLAHFLGQCYHETGGFKFDEENLNYKVGILLKVFKKYFPTLKIAKNYANKPELIANVVYANRMGNDKVGDGWKYRGRGAIQLTGKNNYKEFSNFIKEDCVKNPNLVKNKYFFESALFFFKQNKLLFLCSAVNDNSITVVSKKINGGTNGLEERIEYTKNFYKKIKQ